MNQSLRRRNAPASGRLPPNGGGNARQNYEWYLALGREAQLAWDEVEMQRCYQFAEHYFRVMRAANAPGPEGKGKSNGRASGDRL